MDFHARSWTAGERERRLSGLAQTHGMEEVRGSNPQSSTKSGYQRRARPAKARASDGRRILANALIREPVVGVGAVIDWPRVGVASCTTKCLSSETVRHTRLNPLVRAVHSNSDQGGEARHRINVQQSGNQQDHLLVLRGRFASVRSANPAQFQGDPHKGHPEVRSGRRPDPVQHPDYVAQPGDHGPVVELKRQ